MTHTAMDEEFRRYNDDFDERFDQDSWIAREAKEMRVGMEKPIKVEPQSEVPRHRYVNPFDEVEDEELKSQSSEVSSSLHSYKRLKKSELDRESYHRASSEESDTHSQVSRHTDTLTESSHRSSSSSSSASAESKHKKQKHPRSCNNTERIDSVHTLREVTEESISNRKSKKPTVSEKRILNPFKQAGDIQEHHAIVQNDVNNLRFHKVPPRYLTEILNAFGAEPDKSECKLCNFPRLGDKEHRADPQILITAEEMFFKQIPYANFIRAALETTEYINKHLLHAVRVWIQDYELEHNPHITDEEMQAKLPKDQHPASTFAHYFKHTVCGPAVWIKRIWQVEDLADFVYENEVLVTDSLSTNGSIHSRPHAVKTFMDLVHLSSSLHAKKPDTFFIGSKATAKVLRSSGTINHNTIKEKIKQDSVLLHK
jgi:hypothetical protein